MNCKYLLKRSKNYKPVFYCKLNKRYIDYRVDCENCLKREYKANKSINKASKKRICVSKETYQKVYERDNGACRICGSKCIELHHIYYRSERKDLINDIDNCIMLCPEHHRMVHTDKHTFQSILLELINKNK